MTERTSKREVKQALKASFIKKDQKQSWSEAKKRSDGVQKSEPQLFEGKRMLIRGRISMTRRKFSVTVVRSLATSLLIIGQTMRGNQKKKTLLENILMMNLCY